MDTTRFDAVAQLFGSALTRREALRGLVAGAATLTTASSLLSVEDAAAGKNKTKNKKRRAKKRDKKSNVCDKRNWCVDRTQTCGPAGGYGKCLVKATGGNLCGEILFQAASCAACAPDKCTNCTCVLAAGGGDRCNNGANGHDYICVRAV